MTSASDTQCPGDTFMQEEGALYFLPLGGAGEIGMNLNLYGYAGKWLMIDLGISFGDDTMPGVDIIMPDPAFIRKRRADLVGLVLTHGHEDHLGAVQYLWPDLQCPIFATPFTAAILRTKLHERNLADKVDLIEVPLSGRFEAGPFRLEFVTLTHSIPEPNAVVIRTDAGIVLHSGDWKLDPDPIVGPTVDEAALIGLGEAGVDALVCDSTNALVPGHSGSEAAVRASLTDLFGRYQNRIAVTCFSTNVARLESIATAAAMHDRHVALVGRSLWRISEVARAHGYLKDVPPFLSEHDVGYLPRDKVVLICTGSQGEPRSALARIAGDDHPQVVLESGDVVIFSSREIPGNERAIGRIQNLLTRQGIEVVTAEQEFVHVSGHPAREELVQLYQWVRPRLAVPVHGEDRHLIEHARLARDCQVPDTIVPGNGTIIRLMPGPAEVVDTVQSGRLALDGKAIVPLDAGAMRSRHRMMYNGAAVVTIVLDAQGDLMADPQLAVMGLLDAQEDRTVLAEATAAVCTAIADLPRTTRQIDDEALRTAARIAVRRTVNASHGKKPVTHVHLVRL